MPSRADVQNALTSMKRAADYDFFFDELASPGWIRPLREEGVFAHPPKPTREGGFIGFPFWAASRYLKRVASAAPQEVVEAALEIPETENVRVHEDLVDAALEMPPTIAARLVPRVTTWIPSPYPQLLPDKVGLLIAHLASGGEVGTALTLARALLALRLNPRSKRSDGGLPAEPDGYFADWHYEQILTKAIPVLLEAAPIETFELLIELLEEAVRLSRTLEGDEDYSYLWQPSIEESSQTREHDVRNHLVRALREAAVFAVERGSLTLEKAIGSLRAREPKIFTRIALHLLRQFPERGLQQAKSYVLDRKKLEDATLFHEMWLLLAAVFPRLSIDEQQGLLIALDERLKREETEAAKAPTPEERDRERKSARHWFYRRLTLLRDVLPPAEAARLADLQAEFGPLDHPDFLVHMTGVWGGPTSPKSAQDLSEMSVTDVIEYLRAWKPSGDLMGHSSEGLGGALGSVVASDPTSYADIALEFQGLDPTYVRNLMSGLTEAVKAKRTFQWGRLLELCRWVVSQPRTIPGRVLPEHHELDPDWGWTRKAIAQLIAAGFEAAPGALRWESRETVWSILVLLTDDPDPTPEHEARFGGKNMDPLTLSINSVRGESMHTVVKYALWVRRHLEGQQDPALLAGGFSEIPGVQLTLEKHLRLENDPSLAVRAVYGQWLPWLLLLDAAWTRLHISTIFPRDPALRSYWSAAWHTYVSYVRAFDDVLVALADEYREAIDRLSIGDEALDKDPERPEAKLVEHIMVFYWRGRLPLDDPDGLIQRFYRVAPVHLKAHAIAFIGHVLHAEGDTPLPESVQDRLKALWEWRAAMLQTSPAQERRDEMEGFGWWFASGQLPAEWSLQQLVLLLRMTRSVDASHLVLERLVAVAETKPREAVEAVRWMVEGDDKGWGLTLGASSIELILRTSLASTDAEARQTARNVINYLGAKGDRTYFPLLDSTS